MNINKLDSLPLTNKEKFKRVSDNRLRSMYYEGKKEHFLLSMNETKNYHFVTHKASNEGIMIIWKGNPFKLTKDDNIIRNVT